MLEICLFKVFGDLRLDATHHLEPLFEYFERQWLNNVNLNIWNMFRVRRRTNNAVEGNTSFFYINY